MIIATVWERNAKGKYPQKLVTIPAKSDIKAGDPVIITKVKGEQAVAEENLSAIAKTNTESANQTKAREINEEIRNDF